MLSKGVYDFSLMQYILFLISFGFYVSELIVQILILYENYRLFLVAAIPPRVWAFGLVGYGSSISKLVGGDIRYMSDRKITCI
jgi:hypothetical protein